MPDAAPIDRVNLAEKFSLFTEMWHPKIVGALNGQHVKIAKIKGAFEFHRHEHEDELFLVVRGRMRMDFRDRSVDLEEDEILIVPRGVEHRPVADEEAHILMFEPECTVNTGNVRSDLTVSELEWI